MKSPLSQDKTLLKLQPLAPFRHFHKSKSKESSKDKYGLKFANPELKRIKSEEKVVKLYDMKISAGETACSINTKEIKNSNFFQFG